MTILINNTFTTLGTDQLHCYLDATLVNDRLEIALQLKDNNNVQIAELKMHGTASNPFHIAATVVAAVGYYALCVLFSIAGAAFKVADEGYNNSKNATPNESNLFHLTNAYNALTTQTAALNAETKKVVISCAQKLVPLPTGH
jgi:hypothetical protein